MAQPITPVQGAQPAQAGQPTQTDTPRIKVVTAAGGAGVGGAVAVLICAALEGLIGHKLDQSIQAAIFLLAPLVLAYLAGYYTPPAPHEAVVIKSDGKVVSAA